MAQSQPRMGGRTRGRQRGYSADNFLRFDGRGLGATSLESTNAGRLTQRAVLQFGGLHHRDERRAAERAQIYRAARRLRLGP
jgi:hypothetical protein